MLIPVEIKILDPRLREWGFPVWGSTHAAGLDLHACLGEPLELLGQPVAIPTGFAVHILEPSYCGIVYPRSGLGLRLGLGLANTVGIIDADYQGEITIAAWSARGQRIIINPGDRIAQMVFTAVARPRLIDVAEFGEQTQRGSGKFGSPGVSTPEVELKPEPAKQQDPPEDVVPEQSEVARTNPMRRSVTKAWNNKRREKPKRAVDRDTELEEIDKFIATKGVTRAPDPSPDEAKAAERYNLGRPTPLVGWRS
ncbi:MAG: dUTP diphosphatase [Alphaproteobacteria bacterium]